MPDEAASIPPPTSLDTDVQPDSGSSPRRRSIVGCYLPYAKGSQNYFLGEIEDASEVGAVSAIWFYLRGRPPSSVTQGRRPQTLVDHSRLRWAIFRSVHLSGPAFFVLGTLSMSGINYREFGLGPLIPEDYQKREEPRSEETAEKWSRNGLALGAVLGAIVARDLARGLHVRPIPMFVGLTVNTACCTNIVGNMISGTVEP